MGLYAVFETHDESSVLLVGVAMLQLLTDCTRGFSRSANRMRASFMVESQAAYPVLWILIESTISGMLDHSELGVPITQTDMRTRHTLRPQCLMQLRVQSTL